MALIKYDLKHYANELKQTALLDSVDLLNQAGLVVHESYGQISLSSKGKTQGKKVLGRHMLFKRFLTDTLGVSEATAEKDACRMEHVVSGETIDKLHRYLESQTKKES